MVSEIYAPVPGVGWAVWVAQDAGQFTEIRNQVLLDTLWLGVQVTVLCLVLGYALSWSYVRSPAPLQAITGLVQGCQAAAQQTGHKAYFPNRAMPQRVAWMLDLFERLAPEAKKAGGDVIALSGNHEGARKIPSTATATAT